MKMARICAVAFVLTAAGCGKDLPFMGAAIRPAFDPLAPPTVVKATAVSSTKILVTWNDNSTAETDFRLERVPQGTSMFLYANSNATQFLDTELTEGTTYTYRVSAIGATVASAPSAPTSATTFSRPTLSTSPISDLGSTTATSGGNIVKDGGTPLLGKGVCWSLTTNPTVGNFVLLDTSPSDTYVSVLTGLAPGTTYYLRAFATNSVATSYGSEVVFTTLP